MTYKISFEEFSQEDQERIHLDFMMLLRSSEIVSHIEKITGGHFVEMDVSDQ